MKKFMSLMAAVPILAMLAVALDAKPAAAHHDTLLLKSHGPFVWTDPNSGGRVLMTENVYEGCGDGHPGAENEMKFEYVVDNLTYDPFPDVCNFCDSATNGFSGFQIRFPGQVPELHNQQSPVTGGPWQQNAFSGISPPFGVEWDVPTFPFDVGILPNQAGVFSFCTDEREDVLVEAEGAGFGPAGWGHTWLTTDGFLPAALPFSSQAFIFHGFQSVPGELFEETFHLGVACNGDNHILCKKVKYIDAAGDGIIEVGENVLFRVFVIVRNPSPVTWTDTVVTDRFGAEIDVTSATPSEGTVTLTTKGKSEKVFLEWDIGTLPSGAVATLELFAETDMTPDGSQSYTEPGEFEFNSTAVLKFRRPDGKRRSFESGGILVIVAEDLNNAH